MELVRSSELTFALWRLEQPQGQVLKPDAPYVAEYDPKDWERHVEKTRTVIDTAKSGIAPHQLMLGVSAAGQYRAYPIESILSARLIQDHLGDLPVLLIVGPDQASIRVFEGRLQGESTALTFATGPDPGSIENQRVMVDAETGSTWSFQGCAVEGKLAGRCLKEIDAYKDYWFDWMNHHPDSTVFKS